MTEKQSTQTTKLKFRYNGSAPQLFSIPLGDYADEVERKRDKNLFLKLQAIQKELQTAKEVFESLSVKHSQRMQRCRQLISISREAVDSSYNQKVVVS